MLGEFLPNPLQVRFGLVYLVTATTNRHFSGLRMIDSFDGLRHNTIIGCNNEDNNIGDLCTPSRSAVNASWPGVSRNAMSFPCRETLYAPICCVMPPASVSVTFVSLIASSNEVLP